MNYCYIKLRKFPVVEFVNFTEIKNFAYISISRVSKTLTIYTKEPDVIACGLEILSITTVPYFLCGIMDLFPGALRGMGYSSVPMILSVIGTVGMRILWIFVFFPLHRSLYFLFSSYPASWLATIVMQVICYYFVRKKCLSAVKNPDLEKIRQ